MMKSIILGLFAIFAMNFGFTESKVSVSEEVLKNAEALSIKSLPEACSSCEGSGYYGCREVFSENGEIIVLGCPGQKIKEDEG
ncbi:MAG: hypothetical protein Q4D30_01935 [Bacteroidales bacterium]|nr:hypothetical protein [Bacteroidales bacterium]